jgi:hypothetical protein
MVGLGEAKICSSNLSFRREWCKPQYAEGVFDIGGVFTTALPHLEPSRELLP